jgi:hypothetical protein
MAMKERHLQFALEGADLAADGRLVHAQPFTSPGEVLGLRNLIEQPDLIPVQGEFSR